MASAVGKIGGEQRFDTAAGHSSAGCACAAGIVVLIVVDEADVVLIEPALEANLIDFPDVAAVVVRLAVVALNAAYQDASVVVSD